MLAAPLRRKSHRVCDKGHRCTPVKHQAGRGHACRRPRLVGPEIVSAAGSTPARRRASLSEADPRTDRSGWHSSCPPRRPVADAQSRAHPRDLFTASRRTLPTLNAGARKAAMSIASPVRGLRPRRASFVRMLNVPKQVIAKGQSLASASPMAANTAVTMRSTSALVSERSGATCDAS